MMKSMASLQPDQQPHVDRLCDLATLSPGEIAALRAAARRARLVGARREILQEVTRVREPTIIVSGWAGRVRYFKDGRRQILHLLLPGDLIDHIPCDEPLAPTTIVALTDVRLAPAPIPAHRDTGLDRAYRLANAMELGHLFRQVARLGRFDSFERIADLLIELSERLRSAGLTTGDVYHLPLTQEMLGDCLGLTSVHVNRTLQQLRREGMVEIHGSMVKLLQPDRLRSLVNYQPLRVSGQAD